MFLIKIMNEKVISIHLLGNTKERKDYRFHLCHTQSRFMSTIFVTGKDQLLIERPKLIIKTIDKENLE